LKRNTDSLSLAGKRREKPRWKKVIHLLFRLIIVTGLLALLFYGETFFTVTAVRVVGESSIPASEIIRASGAYNTRNIFLVREKKIASEIIKEYPQLETVEISRNLPGSVMIAVNERVPVASVMTADGYWLIDRNAVCFSFSKDQNPAYPLLTGLDDGSVVPGATLNCPGRVKVLKTFFKNWRGSEQFQLEKIDLGNAYNLILYSDQQMEIWLGDYTAMEQKLNLVEKSLPHLNDAGQLRLDVRSGNRLVVAGSSKLREQEVDP
jgi:cell division septal protein FtsQ